MEHRLAELPFADDLRLRGHVVEYGGGLRLELQVGWGGHHRQRVLVSRDCEVLSEAVVLLVGTPLDASATPILDPPRTPETPGATLVPEAPPRPVPMTIEPQPSEPPPPPRGASPEKRSPLAPHRLSTRRPGILVALSAGVGTGAVADVAAALRLTVGWSWPWLRLALRANYWSPRRHVLPGDSEDRGGWVQAGTLGPQLCFRGHVRAFDIPVCAHLAIGGGRVDGFGPQTGADGGLWVEAGGSVGFAWNFAQRERWSLALALDASIDAPMRSVGYAIDGAELYTPSAVAVSGTLGLAGHFFVQTSR